MNFKSIQHLNTSQRVQLLNTLCDLLEYPHWSQMVDEERQGLPEALHQPFSDLVKEYEAIICNAK